VVFCLIRLRLQIGQQAALVFVGSLDEGDDVLVRLNQVGHRSGLAIGDDGCDRRLTSVLRESRRGQNGQNGGRQVNSTAHLVLLRSQALRRRYRAQTREALKANLPAHPCWSATAKPSTGTLASWRGTQSITPMTSRPARAASARR